jgi:hypothetical protein
MKSPPWEAKRHSGSQKESERQLPWNPEGSVSRHKNLTIKLCNLVYSQKLKHSIIKAPYQKGDKQLISNYRPISLLT